MPDPVTQKQFFEGKEEILQAQLAQHRSIRDALEQFKNALSDQLDRHERDDRTVADRVLTIETERKLERGDAAKRMVWIGIIVSNAIAAIWKIIEHVSKGP